MCCQLFSLSSWPVLWTALLLSSFDTCLLWHIHNHSKWFIFLHLEQILSYAGYLHGSWMFLQHLQLICVTLLLAFALLSPLFFFWCLFAALILCFLLVPLLTLFCALWAFTLLAHIIILCCLFYLPFSLQPALFMISVISSLMPFMNISFNLLSFSLYLHLFAFILRWLFHSLVFLFFSLIN